jgi:acetyltransferase-like isoleucine patch superfamily enzyme
MFKRYFHTGLRVSRALYLRSCAVNVAVSSNISWRAAIQPMSGSIKIGARTFIDRDVILRSYGGAISIGEDCSINCFSVLYGHGGLAIGDNVRIAAHTIIVPANHIFNDPGTPIWRQGLSTIGVTIEDDVWIGAGVRILDGVTVGRGSVIAAGAVVTQSLAAMGVYGGVPAKAISWRGNCSPEGFSSG